MKTWATESNATGDLYYDETPVPKLTISEQFRAMRFVYRTAPKEMVNEMLEAMGLRHG